MTDCFFYAAGCAERTASNWGRYWRTCCDMSSFLTLLTGWTL